jgi:hypothetical protein
VFKQGVTMKIEFSNPIWMWKGPAPWFFVTVPDDENSYLKTLMTSVTYGWGMIPVQARIGKTTWKTSLFPSKGSYVVPIKASVRKAEKLDEGDTVTIELEVG